VGFIVSVRLLYGYKIWRLEKASSKASQINEGMSCTEVQNLLGRPTCVFRTSPRELSKAIWSLQEKWILPKDRWRLADIEKEHESVIVYEYLKWIKIPYIVRGSYGFYEAVIFCEDTGRALLRYHNDFKSTIDLIEILDYRKRESDRRIRPLKQAN
jgi:hypothetical protein